MDEKLILQLLATATFLLLTWRIFKKSYRKTPALRTVAILVLGDIGRSPRMMYHAESFARNEYETFLIGYRGASEGHVPSQFVSEYAAGSKPSPTLRSLPHIRFLYLSEPPSLINRLPFIAAAPIKIVHQVATILVALVVRVAHPPEFIMVQVRTLSASLNFLLLIHFDKTQNPPSIPTLALVWLVGWLRGSKVIIDWHNLGYSILALKLGPNHILVRIAKKYVCIRRFCFH